MRSTLKGKNLLLRKQIPSFKSWLSLRREEKVKVAEWPPLKYTHLSENVLVKVITVCICLLCRSC